MSVLKHFSDICGWLLVIIALAGLAATKPDEAAHRAAFAQRTPVVRALFSVQERLTGAELCYHDYFVFSVMTMRHQKGGDEMPLTFGVLGKVYYGKDQ